ncbi:MAG: transposase [Gemmatimonadetes bacterium]|nr:transposase [Gemmatimonadota bacterium]MYA64858.1 transposase [Gemmatimonadota bacterium]MYB98375.1 transposase [Gemmatimonadota bacterium]MYH54392.1 transposase [Gemmatimonadota bacterium]MYI46505.1 transposase [Gemmatimonadota bacterium]
MSETTEGLFRAALGLQEPWFVESVEFDVEKRKLLVHLNFAASRTFSCGSCGAERCRSYDTRPPKAWRHLDYLGSETYLMAPTPRVTCHRCEGIRLAELTWAGPRTRFTWAFELWIAQLAKRMPLKEVAEIVGEPLSRLRRMVLAVGRR